MAWWHAIPPILAGAAKILSKILQKKKPKKPPKEAKEKADNPSKSTGKRTACANCKKPTRRHNPCKTKGNDPTKENNSMVDPDIATDVGREIDDIIAGNVEKVGDTWTAPSGRSYGEHGGTLFPKNGPGITNISRPQHQVMKELNNKGLDGAQKMIDALTAKGDLSPEDVKEVTEIWKKCKK